MESHFEECPPRTSILVVDNCITTLLNMKQTITQFNYQVMIETSGERALGFLRNCGHGINVVIWDLHMPEVNGIQALKAISSEMDLPVIIMSDDGQYASIMEAIYHGACDYVMKPVSTDKIANIWQHIVRKKMKSKPDSIPEPVQSDLAQSGRLDQVKDDSIRSGSDQEHYTKIKNKGKSAETTEWTEVKIRPYQPKLVQTIDLDQQNGDNGEQNIDKAEENAGKKPRTEQTQVVQTDRLQTGSLEQENVESRVLSEDNNGEGNIENMKKKRPPRPRVFWTGDLHKRFLEAIEIVGGIEKASPGVLLRCLEDMNIEGLTRYNVASHLQKYRISLEEDQIAQGRSQELGSSSSLQAPNNVLTASPSNLLNGQAMNPMQQNQYPSGSLTMNNYQFISDPDCHLTDLPYLDCLRDPLNIQILLSNPHLLTQRRQLSNHQELECQSSNREQHYQPSYQQLLYQISNQQLQYQSANEEQPYQSIYQQRQHQLGNQVQSVNQEHQRQSVNQTQQSESATQQQQYESGNQQPYQLSDQQLQYQSTTQALQYQSADQELPYQAAYQDLQYQSDNHELQHSANQPQQYQFVYQVQSINREHQSQSVNQPQQSESATQQQQYDQQLQYQSTTQELQYQSADQELPYQAANQNLQYQSVNHELQHSANQELPYQSANEPQEYQSADQQQHLQSANEQAPDDISATDVELIYPSLPYDPIEYFLNGHNYNQ